MGGWGWGALLQAEARGSCVYSKVTGRTQVTTGPGRGDIVGAGGVLQRGEGLGHGSPPGANGKSQTGGGRAD